MNDLISTIIFQFMIYKDILVMDKILHIHFHILNIPNNI